MRSLRQQSNNIEEFIKFKLDNFEESSMYGRIYLQQKQYQKKLDKKFKGVQFKQLEYEKHLKNYQRLKQHIWTQLIGYNNQISQIQQHRYRIIEDTRQIIQKRQQIIEQRKRLQIKNQQRQQQLQQQLQTSIKQGQYYFNNKTEDIKQIINEIKQSQKNIDLLQPKIKYYYNLQIQKENKVKKIDECRAYNQNLIKQLWNDTQKLQQIKQKIKSGLKDKQQLQKNCYQTRKQQLNQMFTKINTLTQSLVSKQNSSDQAIEQIRKQIDQYKQSKQVIEQWLDDSELKSDKMKKIISIFGTLDNQHNLMSSSSPSKQSRDILKGIDTDIQTSLQQLIEQNKQKYASQQQKIRELQLKQKQQQKIDQQIQEQIQNLQNNIRKIQANLK